MSDAAAYPLDWRGRSKLRRRLRRSAIGRAAGRVADLALDARQRALGAGRELDALAAESPSRDVLVLGIYAGDGAQLAEALQRIRESVHSVRVVLGSMGPAAPRLATETVISDMKGGKFANLNRIAERAEPLAADWVLLVDDDIAVDRHFLDRLLVVAERFRLSLAQPALSRASYGWWNVNRRRPALVRETRFVEIGPAVLMGRDAYRALAPFPEEGMGWGLCLHWAAVAGHEGWRLGVIDAVPVRHESRRTASEVDVVDARAAAERLLAEREHLTYVEAETEVARHTRIRMKGGDLPRVLVLHNRYRAPAGEERAAAELAALLEERGHAVRLLQRDSGGLSGPRGHLRAGASMLRGAIRPGRGRVGGARAASRHRPRPQHRAAARPAGARRRPRRRRPRGHASAQLPARLRDRDRLPRRCALHPLPGAQHLARRPPPLPRKPSRGAGICRRNRDPAAADA